LSEQSSVTGRTGL